MSELSLKTRIELCGCLRNGCPICRPGTEPDKPPVTHACPVTAQRVRDWAKAFRVLGTIPVSTSAKHDWNAHADDADALARWLAQQLREPEEPHGRD